MGHDHHQQGQRVSSPGDRAAEAQRATWVSVAVNLLMTIAQILVGWIGNSQSLIAHGLEKQEIRLPLGTGIAGHVARTGEIGRVVVTRVENKGRHNRRVYVTFA